MTKDKFPYVAGIIGFVLALIVFKGSALQEDGRTAIPLLTLLVVSEFGAILTAIGAYFGIREFFSTRKFSLITAVSCFCVFLSIQFLVRGLQLWPN